MNTVTIPDSYRLHTTPLGQLNPRSSLQNAVRSLAKGEEILTLPEICKEKTLAPHESFLWHDSFLPLFEEDYGTTTGNKGAVVVVHGGGIYTTQMPDGKFFDETLTGVVDCSTLPFRHTSDESKTRAFRQLLKGKLPNGNSIPILSYSEFNRLSEKPRVYGVVLDGAKLDRCDRGIISLGDKNPLFAARVGGEQEANKYLDAIAESNSGRFGEKIRYHASNGYWHDLKSSLIHDNHNPNYGAADLSSPGAYIVEVGDGLRGYFGRNRCSPVSPVLIRKVA